MVGQKYQNSIPKDLWPPSSPDLTLLTYGIQGLMCDSSLSITYQNLEEFDEAVQKIRVILPGSAQKLGKLLLTYAPHISMRTNGAWLIAARQAS